MSWFIWIFVWLRGCAVISGHKPNYRYENIGGKKEIRYGYLWVIVALLPIVFMVANRTNAFGDTIVYRRNYLNMPGSIGGMASYLATISKDKGFRVLSILIKCVIGNKDKVYFGVLAVLQGGIVYCIYRKYSSQYWLSIFLFLASTDYVAWMYNGIRQFTAVVIIFAGTGFLVKGKYIPTILLILLASTMHQSALIMIPIIFIVQGKALNKRTLLVLVIMILAVVYVDRFTGFMQSALEDTQYTNVVRDYTEINDDGTNPIRVLVYSIPAIMAILLKRWVDLKSDKLINMCVNMSIITMGLYLVSMVTSGIFLGRLPIYTSLYSYILVPWLINEVFEERSRNIVYTFMIVLYLAFYYYQMHMAWGLI